MKPELHTEVTKSGILLDRELSQLTFNRRVMAQAEDPNIPLLERLRYLCIVSSNMDEFFEVRVASLLAAGSIGGSLAGHPALAANLERIGKECHALVERQYEILNSEVLPALREAGVHLLRDSDRNERSARGSSSISTAKYAPADAHRLDPAHPFPQVVNKSLNFIVSLSGKDAFGRGTAIAILKAPRVLPRVIRLPDDLSDRGGISFCLLSSVIHAHISDLFAGREVIAYSQFRVTRDSDLWVDEDEVKNLRQALKGELVGRQFGTSVRLEVARNCPPELSQFLLDQFSLDQSRLYRVNGPVNLVRLSELIDHVKQPELRFPPFFPGLAHKAIGNDIFAALSKHDILLHHPYQSFQTVIDFIRSAAYDPSVVAIKQTIYRTGMNSDLMESLITAAKMARKYRLVN